MLMGCAVCQVISAQPSAYQAVKSGCLLCNLGRRVRPAPHPLPASLGRGGTKPGHLVNFVPFSIRCHVPYSLKTSLRKRRRIAFTVRAEFTEYFNRIRGTG